MLSIRLPEELELRLSNLAEKTGRTKTFYVREAIENSLDDMEDLYLGLAILEDVKSGKEELLTPKAMWHGLGD